MIIRCGILLWVATFALIGGCTYKLKDDAPANRLVAAADIPTTLIDREGNQIDLTMYRGTLVVLVVVRGMPESPGGVFCPYCLSQASSLASNFQEFKSRGVEVLLVFPGPGDKAAEFTKQVQSKVDSGNAMPYTVCVDKDCSACDRLGIRGDLAKPSTFILDRDGQVAYAYVGKSTSDRPSVVALLKELDRLK